MVRSISKIKDKRLLEINLEVAGVAHAGGVGGCARAVEVAIGRATHGLSISARAHLVLRARLTRAARAVAFEIAAVAGALGGGGAEALVRRHRVDARGASRGSRQGEGVGRVYVASMTDTIHHSWQCAALKTNAVVAWIA